MSAGVQSHHQAALDQGNFLIQHCGACCKHVYFPRESCPHCGAADLAWVTPSGHGTVYSTTTVRRKPDAGGDYNVSLIDLDEGVRLMSRVVDVSPDAVCIGQRVTASVQMTSEKGLIVFHQQAGKVVTAINSEAAETKKEAA
jgi:uncharacterized OB-fold protein